MAVVLTGGFVPLLSEEIAADFFLMRELASNEGLVGIYLENRFDWALFNRPQRLAKSIPAPNGMVSEILTYSS